MIERSSVWFRDPSEVLVVSPVAGKRKTNRRRVSTPDFDLASETSTAGSVSTFAPQQRSSAPAAPPELEHTSARLCLVETRKKQRRLAPRASTFTTQRRGYVLLHLSSAVDDSDAASGPD